MIKVILSVLLAYSFLACSEKKIEVEPKVVLGKSLESLTLKDQRDVSHSITSDTKIVIFALSKDMGHLSNDFFESKDSDFLSKHNSILVADVSGAPSLIRSMFIMPGLKDFKHTVLILDDKTKAASYKDEKHSDKLNIVYVDNFIIKDIKYVSTKEELEKVFAK